MNPKKNVSKWKTAPSRCARIAKHLCIVLIAFSAATVALPCAHAAAGGNPGASHFSASNDSGTAGTAAMAGFGAVGMLISGERRARKFFEPEGGRGGGGGDTKKAMDLIKEKIGALRGRANDALSKLKPLEQHEGADRMGYFFRAMEDAHERVGDMLNHIEQGILPQYEAAMESAQQEALKDPKFVERVIEQAVQKGDLVKKADADGRVQTAQQAAYDKAKSDLQAESDKQSKIGVRRGEAIALMAPLLKKDKINGAAASDGVAAATELCSKLSDDSLLGDNYKEAISGAVARVKRCGELGVTEPGVLQEVCAMEPAAYEKQVKTWEDIAKASRGSGPRLNPFASGGGNAGDRQSRGNAEEKPKRVIC